MECAYADHLRNLALASISLELKVRGKRRSTAISLAKQRTRDTQPLVMLQKKTDEDRKALRDHIANCRRCQNAAQAGSPRSSSEDLAPVAEMSTAREPVD